MDYLEVSYDPSKTPLTEYPFKLAQYVYDRAALTPNLSFLDVGSGRSEMASSFKKFGLNVVSLDESSVSRSYADTFEIPFIEHKFSVTEPFPIPSNSFDIVFSKSFIEHMVDPIFFIEECHRILRPSGKIIVLTPDWEANMKIFFDDVTHVSPFSIESLNQVLELCNFENNKVFKFRQLPLAWKYKWYDLLARIVAPFVPVRTKLKFFRWSRELMLFGLGEKR